jgi:hypothetical protein
VLLAEALTRLPKPPRPKEPPMTRLPAEAWSPLLADFVEKLHQSSDEPALRCEQIESRVGDEGSGGIKFDCWRSSGISFPLRSRLQPSKSFFNTIGPLPDFHDGSCDGRLPR